MARTSSAFLGIVLHEGGHRVANHAGHELGHFDQLRADLALGLGVHELDVLAHIHRLVADALQLGIDAGDHQDRRASRVATGPYTVKQPDRLAVDVELHLVELFLAGQHLVVNLGGRIGDRPAGELDHLPGELPHIDHSLAKRGEIVFEFFHNCYLKEFTREAEMISEESRKTGKERVWSLGNSH